MPKAIGQPLTITNGQPQREVERFTAFVSYDTDGTPRFRFDAYTVVRLRDAAGNIVHQEPNLTQLIGLSDAQLPAAVRTAFTAILNKLDTLPDPTPWTP